MERLNENLPELRHVSGLVLALRFPRQVAAIRAVLWALDRLSRPPERAPDRRRTGRRLLGGAMIAAGLALPLLARQSRQA
jgi:hypothetical protein